MSQWICQPELSEDSSNATFNATKTVVLPDLALRRLFDSDDSDIAPSSRILAPFNVFLDVRKLTFEVLTIPQLDGSFVTRAVTERFCANGQGETLEEALQDIKEAIDLLLEENENPSGDAPWPKDYQ